MTLKDEKPLPDFSPEELALFNSTDEELKATAYKQSFDGDALLERIRGDRFNQILHAHLHLDHIVTLLLTDEFKRPAAIDLDRVGFSQKLQLIHALALVPASFVPSVRFLNQMRNRLAHRLDAAITDDDVQRLFDRLSPEMKLVVKESERMYKKRDRLTIILVHILFAAENFRQVNAHRRLDMRRHMLRVRSFLRRLDEQLGPVGTTIHR